MNNNRLVCTPRVEVGSKEYWADVALMKLFYDYEDYLDYEEDVAIWFDIEETSSSTLDCLSKDNSHSHLMRRKITSKSHRRLVKNSEILIHKAEKNPHVRMETGYKRVRILRPQCVGLENIRFDGYYDVDELATSFDSAYAHLYYLLAHDFPTYHDYLCYLAKHFASEEFHVGLRFDVSGLRIAQRSPKSLQFIPIKAEAYGKRANCLYGKKKRESQKASFAIIVNGSTESKDNDDEPVPERRSIYSNRKFNVLHAVSSHTDSVKESKVEIRLVSSPIVPRFF